MHSTMKFLSMAAVATGFAVVAHGQTYVYPQPGTVYAPVPTYAPAPPVVAPVAVPRLADAQIDQLTASIALYPDPLVAEILPASTYPLEIVTAAQWLRSYPQPTEEAINA